MGCNVTLLEMHFDCCWFNGNLGMNQIAHRIEGSDHKQSSINENVTIMTVLNKPGFDWTTIFETSFSRPKRFQFHRCPNIRGIASEVYTTGHESSHTCRKSQTILRKEFHQATRALIRVSSHSRQLCRHRIDITLLITFWFSSFDVPRLTSRIAPFDPRTIVKSFDSDDIEIFWHFSFPSRAFNPIVWFWANWRSSSPRSDWSNLFIDHEMVIGWNCSNISTS
jgi:hypothetical protein